MEKVLKSPYVEAELEIVVLDKLDIITTSDELGGGGDVDDGGWTSSSTRW